MNLHFCAVNKVGALPRCRAPFAAAIASITIPIAGLITGCGGGGASASTSTVNGNTTVVVMGSSTANDQLTGFASEIKTLTLTSKTGKQVALISSPVDEEFIHLNGIVEPLATLSIPQDTYVSATATADIMDPLCSGQIPGELYGDQMANLLGVTVNLPAPITVTGKVLGLVLNLDVSKSTPFSGACPPTLATVPPSASVFNLTPLTIAAEPTNSANGKALGLRGIIGSAAADGSNLTVNALSSYSSYDSPSWTVTVNAATTLQGGASTAQLVAGAAVDMDAAVQQDGSLLATRIALMNANQPNLTVAAGPVIQVSTAGPVALVYATSQQGYLSPYMSGAQDYNFGKAAFQTSSQLTNVAALPFAANFNATNMVVGQRVMGGTQAASPQQGTNYPLLMQVTLLPQTINGTVSAISAQGNFTAYTVQLAPYDLFPILAVQPGQTTLLTTPNTIVVYADSNTQTLNSGAISIGSVLRFYGLVFNDSGTLRMDCAQVSDGVPE